MGLENCMKSAMGIKVAVRDITKIGKMVYEIEL